ncbi:DEAD/DEAH box helicase family protein [Pedobacter sp. MC2016-15]|uniref:DEAD/DEAH box helicase n=1 Tax=Pedobacter sp. MC2016-15 TaxID=2994473 RepID=UPI002245C0D1|nr:DEAD/DEAH box helicase family protein [Pedobacter sp. MC2016-15]MCX2481537.1 DEAD/DEAH box helicase family protein [Pedobacter sp. MC2016-15]
MQPENHSAILPATKRKLYSYQQHDLQAIFDRLEDQHDKGARLLYQLPTGGGKTVIFSEIAKRFIATYGKKVIVLTHRTELCRQTTTALKKSGVTNKVIDSSVKNIPLKDKFECYVAMVETLKRRIQDKLINTADVGLVIVDEAHHNSFHKLLGNFPNASVIGVTATPFSSDINLPMNKFYKELILGESISSLIGNGFLASPKIKSYEVELNSLNMGLTGDYTVSSSDALYGSEVMLDLLLHAYREYSVKKKTLIFNNGIFASRCVLEAFTKAGYPIRHLDNKTLADERVEILAWFKKTKGAILTSVSILTTGFDEPTIQSVILYRATTSLTLYHQMVGRGARRLAGKKSFTVTDLGNNIERFGEWHTEIDWKHVFEHPDVYHQSLHSAERDTHTIPLEMRNQFSNSLEVAFDVVAAYQKAINSGAKAKTVMRDSIRQHAMMCLENSDDEQEALDLIPSLDREIDYRVKLYGKCLSKVTRDYVKWLGEDYRSRLKILIHKLSAKRRLLASAG